MKSKTVKLEVNGEKRDFKFSSLAWEDYPSLMGLLSKFKVNSDDPNEIMDSLTKENTEKLMELEYKMFSKSYPNLKEGEIKEIILENMFTLLEPLIETNLGK